ncbi:hypothetical protein HEP87_56060 [Streptomyces sp. S1D4-11]
MLRCDLVRDQEDGPGEDVDDADFVAWWALEEELLDVVDAVLDILPGPAPPAAKTWGGQAMEPGVFEFTKCTVAYGKASRRLDRLRQLLDDGRSAYTLRADGRALVCRVDTTVSALTEGAAQAAEQQPNRGSASAHLRRAYAAAYALHPDPVRAYSECVKAVESAMHKTLEPNNIKATRGSMLRELRQHPGRFVAAIPGRSGTEGVVAVEAMASLLWTGQTSRHGGQRPTSEETQAQHRWLCTLPERSCSGSARERSDVCDTEPRTRLRSNTRCRGAAPGNSHQPGGRT